MNPKIISLLRNRSKFSKRYYSNPTEENKNLLIAKSSECSNMIDEAKKMHTNPKIPNFTIPKTYWFILNTSLNNRKYQIYPH